MKIEKPKKVDKVWGHELWIYNDEEYCGKLLVFDDAYSKFSMHYHMIKKLLVVEYLFIMVRQKLLINCNKL